MQNQAQHLADAVAASAANPSTGLLATAAPLAPRPRSIREILDIDQTYVPGFPLQVDAPKRAPAE
jgi:hypothetical protein